VSERQCDARFTYLCAAFRCLVTYSPQLHFLDCCGFAWLVGAIFLKAVCPSLVCLGGGGLNISLIVRVDMKVFKWGTTSAITMEHQFFFFYYYLLTDSFKRLLKCCLSVPRPTSAAPCCDSHGCCLLCLFVFTFNPNSRRAGFCSCLQEVELCCLISTAVSGWRHIVCSLMPAAWTILKCRRYICLAVTVLPAVCCVV